MKGLKNAKRFFVSVMVLTVMVGIFAIQPASAFSLTSTVIKPFGGRITAIIPPVPFECWVPRIVVGPPRPIVAALAPPITIIYDWRAISVGNWVLGIAIPPIPFICDVPIVWKIGTSLTP